MSFPTTQAHLRAELDRIRLLLEAVTKTTPQERDPPTSAAEETGIPGIAVALPDPDRRELARDQQEIERQCAETDAETTLRLEIVADRFDLSRDHLDVLLMALATNVDKSFEELFQQLHGDLMLSEPTVGLIEDLYVTDETTPFAASELLGTHSPLRRHGFIGLGDPVDNSTSRRRRPIVVSDHLVEYLLGQDGLDPMLEGAATLLESTTTVDDLQLEDDVADRVTAVAATDTDPRIHYFYGPDGSEKRRAVEAIADDRVLRADLDALLEANLLERFRREALLQDCPVHLTNVTDAITSEQRPDAEAAEAGADTGAGVAERLSIGDVVAALWPLERDLFLTGEEQWTPASEVREVEYVLIEFPKPGFELRKRLWDAHEHTLDESISPTVLASTFELTQGQIENAVTTAQALTDDESTTVSREAILEGCKAQSTQGLDELAERIEPNADWEQIILKPDTERQLREVASHIKHRGTVYEEWGFEERFSRGSGVVALFAGPSGTGKTMAAEIIADDAGMDIYKIDLSSVVSKYIGETEENLERIFNAARDSNAVLLFDEADAVFGQRAEVSDATDRYANVEVNYLLQRIETYDGVVLLTTNNESHIDDAFMRRISQTVTFQQPDETARKEIWKIMFPEATPTADLDYEFLASLELSGGNIRNVAQTAAILAVEDGTVEMRHVVEACRRELEKLGGLLDPTDFGEYKHLLQTDPDTRTASQDEQSDASTTDPTEITAKDVISQGMTAREALAQTSAQTGSETATDRQKNAVTQPAGSARDSLPADETSTASTGASTSDGSAPADSGPSAAELARATSEQPNPNQTDSDGSDEVSAETQPDDTVSQTSQVSDNSAQTTQEHVEAGQTDSDGEEDTDSDGERETDDASDGTQTPVSGTPELVVERFFDYLNDGDDDAAYSLYHSEGFGGEFSPRELIILEQKGVSIKNDFERLVDRPDRVVLRFTQELGRTEAQLEYDLRPEAGSWRIFNPEAGENW